MSVCNESKPYVFISYSHRDSERVFSIIHHLRESGFNVWWDEGIDPGTEWDENIAKHVKECSYFVAFISKGYVASKNCKDELNYSRDLDKGQLLVYLEDVELPDGMAMRMNRIQSIFWHKYPHVEDAFAKLFSAKGIEVTRVAVESVPAMSSPDIPVGSLPGTTPVQAYVPPVQTPVQPVVQPVQPVQPPVQPVYAVEPPKAPGKADAGQGKMSKGLLYGLIGGGAALVVLVLVLVLVFALPRGEETGDTVDTNVELEYEYKIAKGESFDNVFWINKDYYVVKYEEGGDNWYLTGYATDSIVPDSSLGDFGNGWTDFSLSQDGAFIAYRSIDGHKESCLFGADLSVLRTMEDGYILDYRDGIVVCEKEGLTNAGIKRISCVDGNWEWLTNGQYNMGNGYLVLRPAGSCQSEIVPLDDLKALLYVKEAEEGPGIGSESLGDMYNAFRPKVDGYQLTLHGIPSDNGWIVAYLYDDSDSNVDVGLYNIKTEEYRSVLKQTGAYSIAITYGVDGCLGYSELYDNVCALAVEETDQSSTGYIWQFYDFKEQKYVSDRFLSIQVEANAPERWILVQNLDKKWGYLDWTTWQLGDNWYDDATPFHSGIALIVTQGAGAFFIGDDLNRCSSFWAGVDHVDRQTGIGVNHYLGNLPYAWHLKNDGKWQMVRAE